MNLRRRVAVALLFWAASSAGAVAQVRTIAAEGGASFVATFDRLSPVTWRISHDWSGGIQDCTWSKESVRLRGGRVHLLLTRRPDGVYSCAEMQTRKMYGYGTYELRLKASAASGVLTTFFIYTQAGEGDAKQSQQISLEFAGKNTRVANAVYVAEGQKQYRFVNLDFDAAEGMNDYALEWLPQSLRWFVNGHVVYEVKRTAGAPFPQYPGKIILSLWNGKPSTQDWLGPFDMAAGALDAAVEHFAFTRMGDACQFAASVACRNTVGRSAHERK